MTELQIQISGDFAGALQSTASTLVISCYHAGKLLLLNVDDGGRLRLTPVGYRKPMGIAVDHGHLAVATLDEIHLYADSPRLASRIEGGAGKFEHAYFPRITYHCGPLDLHDLCFVGSELWAVNTRFSCISSFDPTCNFTPRWRPRYISAITPEDRCHLNGLAIEDGKPAYATALGSGDTAFSWREHIKSGGVLMSIPDNQIVLRGLSMPHSPRLAGNSIYLLESARGALVCIDRQRFEKRTVLQLDGLVRGLCVIGATAFIGISKVREESPTFARLDDCVKAEHAAIHAVDLNSGRVLGSLKFISVVEEIYDIQAIPWPNSVAVLGLYDTRHKQAVATPDEVYWKRTPPGAH